MDEHWDLWQKSHVSQKKRDMGHPAGAEGMPARCLVCPRTCIPIISNFPAGGPPFAPFEGWDFPMLAAWYSVPIQHAHTEIAARSLAISSTVTQTRLRARGVKETRHSVTVADAGSNPAGSILPFVEEKFMRENAEIISSSNLTLPSTSPILK